ncbi:Imm1 family immunity protein [Actinosynnema sp. NPDC059797]
MVDLEAWYDADHDGPTVVRTPAELDAVLDVVAGWEGRIIVDVYVVANPARAVFNIGVHGQAGRGALYYSGDSGSWFSKGTPGPDRSPTEPILYYYMNNDTEFPGDCEIPLDVVRRAAHEFMTTGGERPTVTNWQPRPPVPQAASAE